MAIIDGATVFVPAPPGWSAHITPSDGAAARVRPLAGWIVAVTTANVDDTVTTEATPLIYHDGEPTTIDAVRADVWPDAEIRIASPGGA